MHGLARHLRLEDADQTAKRGHKDGPVQRGRVPLLQAGDHYALHGRDSERFELTDQPPGFRRHPQRPILAGRDDCPVDLAHERRAECLLCWPRPLVPVRRVGEPNAALLPAVLGKLLCNAPRVRRRYATRRHALDFGRACLASRQPFGGPQDTSHRDPPRESLEHVIPGGLQGDHAKRGSRGIHRTLKLAVTPEIVHHIADRHGARTKLHIERRASRAQFGDR